MNKDYGRPTIVEKRVAERLRMAPLEVQVIIEVYIEEARKFHRERLERGPSLYDKAVAEGRIKP